MKLRKITKKAVFKKRVLVRCDFDVPLIKKETKEGKLKFIIEDDTRIQGALLTINYLIKNKAEKIILISHLGRPKGKKDFNLSLRPVAESLKKILNTGFPVLEIEYNGFEAFQIAPNLILLENIRFYPGEEENSPLFARKLARLGDVFVMDAFATAHRSSASIVGISRYLPSFAGLRLFLEVSSLQKILNNPRRPFVVIMGGAKLSDKIEVISNLLPKVDYFLVGGGIANTFLAALGYGVGRSLIDVEKIPLVQDLFKKYSSKIILPEDVVVTDNLSEKGQLIIKEVFSLPQEICPSPYLIADIGPKTVKKYSQIIEKAKTLLWNGPLGVYEVSQFALGTKKIGKVFAKVAAGKPYGVVGGGDVVGALKRLKVIGGIDYISTGGGAMLEFLAGKKLPGIEILKTNSTQRG